MGGAVRNKKSTGRMNRVKIKRNDRSAPILNGGAACGSAEVDVAILFSVKINSAFAIGASGLGSFEIREM